MPPIPTATIVAVHRDLPSPTPVLFLTGSTRRTERLQRLRRIPLLAPASPIHLFFYSSIGSSLAALRSHPRTPLPNIQPIARRWPTIGPSRRVPDVLYVLWVQLPLPLVPVFPFSIDEVSVCVGDVDQSHFPLFFLFFFGQLLLPPVLGTFISGAVSSGFLASVFP